MKAQRVPGRFASSDCVEFRFVSQPVDAQVVVVFLHGLDTDAEHGWSQTGSAKTFVTRITEDIPAAAVGTFAYPCTLRDFVSGDLSLDALARGVAEVFREHLLEAYHTIVVIGHCLGGAIAVTALRLLSERAPQQTVWSSAWARLVLFLIDAPFAVPDEGPSEWLRGLMKTLTYTEELAKTNAEFWVERILGRPERRLPVEAHALISAGPSWVTPLRPDAWLPDINVRRLALSHLDIARSAADEPFPTYEYVIEQLGNFKRQ